jgi:hypothetical protein
MPPPIIPVVQTWGTPTSLRYALTDTTGRYWTGSAWAARQGDARLYAGHHDATADARRILLRQFRGHTVYQQFVVPLVLTVYADAEVTPAELTDFGRKLLKVSALYADHGTGPIPDSLLLPVIKWGNMTQPVNSVRDIHIDE